ncbi:ArsC/Spx/MgsR family protein [Undibacterium sp. SXout7W]|uniref:ArsC/Spx/MgsR family protein n=1 Tax=Undibacterium sp. SXout7W TaxID=3413049 RepID=UPI003BF19E27
MITIYHHPRCSKSRETLAIVEQIATDQHLALEVIEYQKSPPTPEQLTQLLQQLGGDIQTMLRSNEEEYALLGLAHADAATALAVLTTHPALLQRPIVSYNGKAAIGRPPENVLSLFKKA